MLCNIQFDSVLGKRKNKNQSKMFQLIQALVFYYEEMFAFNKDIFMLLS